MSTIHACWLKRISDVNQILDDMSLASAYWFPDEHSRWQNQQQTIGLAKAHLFNTASSYKDKVYCDLESELVITANARIDNRTELGNLLGLNSQLTTTIGEGELILRAYQHWGKTCVRHLRGDFAFILWDAPQQKFFCARDHFGIKVLFYSLSKHGVMLSNEHNAFFTSNWLKSKTVKEEWLVEQIWGLCPQSFDSPYNDIQVVAPAHTLEIDQQGAITLEPYWDLRELNTWSHYQNEDYIQELQRRFHYAVEVRMASEFPLGAELSEGLDSTTIACALAKKAPDKVIYTLSYDCESPTGKKRDIWQATYNDILEIFAMHKNLKPLWQQRDLNEIQYMQDKKQTFYKNFGGVFRISDSLFVRTELAQKHTIRTLFSGWGGDHCVTSYGDNLADELFLQRNYALLWRLLNDKYKRGRGGRPFLSLGLLALKYLFPSLYRPIKKHIGMEKVLRLRAKKHFLGQQWRKKFSLDKKFDNQNKKLDVNSVKQKERLELFGLGLANRLVESELVGRQNRLEYRFPMLDVDLVEFAHNLPSQLKIQSGIERFAFRQSIQGLTTERIRWRRKADIEQPKLNWNLKVQQQYEFLCKQLANSPLLSRYGSDELLKKGQPIKDRILLRQLNYLNDVEIYSKALSNCHKDNTTLAP